MQTPLPNPWRTLVPWLWTSALLWTSPALAQAGVVQPLLGEEAREKQQITFERQKGLVVQVRWGKHQIPMTERPPANLECGLSRDGEQMVMLANGVRDSLDIYVVGKKAGDFHCFQTGGGRQLRRDFNDGQGSWPWVEGSHLILYGYEKDGKLEFQAASRKGQVHASRQLDLALKGWKIESDPDRGYVRVRFAGVAEPLEFHHPLSPRLELVNGLLEFGTVQLGSSTRQLLRLHNSGKRPLTLRLGLLSEQFELGATEATERRLAPGEHSRIAVVFKPKTAGLHEARMKLAASGSIRELLVVLRGEAQAASKVTTATTSKPTTPQPHDTTPKAPSMAEQRLHPLGGGEVLVMGRINMGSETGTAGPMRLSVRNALTHAEVSTQADAAGRFHARLMVQDFVRVQVAAADGQRRSEWVELGVVQPQLEIAGEGKDLIVRCLPNQQFLLLAVPPQGSAGDGEQAQGSARIFGSWRGRASASGLARYPLGSFGAKGTGTAPMALVLVTEVDGEKRTSPRLLLP